VAVAESKRRLNNPSSREIGIKGMKLSATGLLKIKMSDAVRFTAYMQKEVNSNPGRRLQKDETDEAE